MFIIDSLYGVSGGGTENHLFHLTNLLNKDKFKCYIVAFDTGDTSLTRKIKANGVDIIHIPVKKYYTPQAIVKAFQLAKYIRKLQIDIVQTYHFKSDTYGVLIAKLSGVKKIVSSKRDAGDRKTKWHFFLNRRFQRFIDTYIAVAQRIGYIINEKENVPLHKIRTIYNGVDLKIFHPTEIDYVGDARQKIGLRQEDFVVGMVAVFRSEKSHDIFFEGIEKAMNAIPNIKAIAVGGGPLLNFYKEYCQKNGLYGKVIFTEDTADVRPYLQIFDLAVLVPGSNEGFSNSILEKMAFGLPLIVSDVGGNAEAVLNGYNGIVIPPNDSLSLAEAITDLYNHPQKRKLMGFLSRKRLEELFSLEKMIRDHEELYLSLIER